jgi:hypothetical protein
LSPANIPVLSVDFIAAFVADMEGAAFEVESLLSDPPHAVSVKERATRATPTNPIFRMPNFLFLIPLGIGGKRNGLPPTGTKLPTENGK